MFELKKKTYLLIFWMIKKSFFFVFSNVNILNSLNATLLAPWNLNEAVKAHGYGSQNRNMSKICKAVPLLFYNWFWRQLKIIIQVISVPYEFLNIFFILFFIIPMRYCNFNNFSLLLSCTSEGPNCIFQC